MTAPREARPLLALVGAGVAGAGAVTYLSYQRDIRQARQRISGRSQIVATSCGPIEYSVVGDGPAVLVVHGAGGGFDQGLDFAKPLIDSGFRIIAMSRFGYLRTPLPEDASAAAQADAHACLLDALKIERAAIVGVSAGAPSSMQFALRHPERCSAMVLVVPVAYVPVLTGRPPAQPFATQFLFDTALRSDLLFWLGTKLAPNTMMRAILATPPEVMNSAPIDERARAQQILHNILPVSERRQGLLNDAAVVSSLPRYELERITTPTLVISVADDLFGTFEKARYTAQHIPGARFVGYETGGHVWVDHQKEVVSEIAALIRSDELGRTPAR
jgi:2-hydroxy-6-oxonona-2,4-dienedioate hydrolase